MYELWAWYYWLLNYSGGIQLKKWRPSDQKQMSLNPTRSSFWSLLLAPHSTDASRCLLFPFQYRSQRVTKFSTNTHTSTQNRAGKSSFLSPQFLHPRSDYVRTIRGRCGAAFRNLVLRHTRRRRTHPRRQKTTRKTQFPVKYMLWINKRISNVSKS